MLATAALGFAALAQHSERGWLSAPARWIHAWCRPWPALAAMSLALLPQIVAAAAHPAPQGKPNVVFILLDSVRLDHVGWGGSALPTTPRLDALAREGASFTQAITQASWTKPSVATLMTGRTPAQHGATGRFTALPRERRTLAEAFAAAGYRTYGFSSNPNVSTPFHMDQGFQVFGENTSWDAATLIEEARRAAHPADADARPYFLYLHLNDAHYPYEPPATSRTEAGERPIRGTFQTGRTAPRLDGEAERQFRANAGATFSEAEVEAMRLAYAEEILALDDQVGSLVEKLLAARDDVLIVICADHGEEFLDHGDLGHGHSLHEELVRVPLMFVWGKELGRQLGLQAGVRTQQVALLDVPATLLEAAGLLWPASAEPQQGRSLLPSLRGAEDAGAAAFAETDYMGSPLSGFAGPLRMWREPSAKLVISDPWHGATAGRTWLYDLAQDPGERSNAAAALPELARRLRASLDASGFLFERELTDVGAEEISASMKQNLAALGYADGVQEPVDPADVRFAPRAVPWLQDPR